MLLFSHAWHQKDTHLTNSSPKLGDTHVLGAFENRLRMPRPAGSARLGAALRRGGPRLDGGQGLPQGEALLLAARGRREKPGRAGPRRETRAAAKWVV